AGADQKRHPRVGLRPAPAERVLPLHRRRAAGRDPRLGSTRRAGPFIAAPLSCGGTRRVRGRGVGREGTPMHTPAHTPGPNPPPRKPPPAPDPVPLTAIWRTVQDFFSLDLRTLALFRVLLAYLLLADLANRWPDLTALYSDEGSVPRLDFFK